MTRPVNVNSLLANAALSSARKGLPLTLNFGGEATLEITIADEIFATAVMGVVQGIFVDNIDNAHSVTLTFPGVQSRGHKIKCPAASQMWMPLPVNPGAFTFKAEGTIGDIAYIELLNVPVAPCVWPSANVANVTANFAPLQVSITDRTDVGTGGPQLIMAANPARQYFYIQNAPTNANVMTLNFGNGGAAISLFPGGSYQSEFVVSTDDIYVTATAGEVINAGEA